MKAEGYGMASGGGFTGGSVPLPKKPVVYRGRKKYDSGFVVHNQSEFTNEQLAPRRGPGPSIDYSKRRRDYSDVTTPPEIQQRIVELYQEGLPTRAVALKLGVSSTTVNRYLKEAGVPLRARGGQTNPVTEKTCAWPSCGKTFTRRENERSEQWKRRRTCSHQCAGRLAASVRFGTR